MDLVAAHKTQKDRLVEIKNTSHQVTRNDLPIQVSRHFQWLSHQDAHQGAWHPIYKQTASCLTALGGAGAAGGGTFLFIQNFWDCPRDCCEKENGHETSGMAIGLKIGITIGATVLGFLAGGLTSVKVSQLNPAYQVWETEKIDDSLRNYLIDKYGDHPELQKHKYCCPISSMPMILPCKTPANIVMDHHIMLQLPKEVDGSIKCPMRNASFWISQVTINYEKGIEISKVIRVLMKHDIHRALHPTTGQPDIETAQKIENLIKLQYEYLKRLYKSARDSVLQNVDSLGDSTVAIRELMTRCQGDIHEDPAGLDMSSYEEYIPGFHDGSVKNRRPNF